MRHAGDRVHRVRRCQPRVPQRIALRHSFCSSMGGMKATSDPDRKTRLLEQVVSRARSLRDERERLARRLTELEDELNVLASKLDGRPAVITLTHGERRRP